MARASCPANVELTKGARFTFTITYKRPVPSKYTIKAIEDLGKPSAHIAGCWLPIRGVARDLRLHEA